MTFNLNEQLAKINTGTGPVPQEHKFTLTAVRTQNLVVMSQTGMFLKKESGGTVTKELVGGMCNVLNSFPFFAVFVS